MEGRTVWQEQSTFLAPSGQRTRSAASSADAHAKPNEPLARWRVAANAGRRYSRVTGDWNPIHVSAWTARLFGYPRAIAHGMWSLGRCAALLQPVEASTGPTVLEARFKRPLMLPGQVALYATSSLGPATHFRLAVEPTGEPHIEGRIETGPGVE
jgi:acyl dehydratase